MSTQHTPPRVVIVGVSEAGWFASYLSLRAWARHGRGICRHCTVAMVYLDGDLA